MTKKIDWPRVRRAREELATIAREHPELIGKPSEVNRLAWEKELEDMGRQPTLGETAQVAFRLPVALIDRLDRHVERMRQRAGGMVAFTRADAARTLLEAGLAAVEAGDAETGKRKR